MTKIANSSFILFITLNALSLRISAQQAPTYRVAEGWSIENQRKPIASYQATEGGLARGVFDPRADTLLRAAEAFTKRIVGIRDLRFERAVTFQVASNDDLAVQWRIGESANEWLLLKDTPYISEYDLRLSHREVVSRQDLTAFLCYILVCGEEPLHLEPDSIDMFLPAAPPGIHAFAGEMPGLGLPIIRMINTAGFDDGEHWFVTVRVSKTFTSSYYPVPRFVPERFPPLTELVRSWSFDRIWAEIGGPPDDPEIHNGSFSERDTILITELASRGLSPEQLTNLITTTKRPSLYSHVLVVLHALNSAGKDKAVGEVLEPVLARLVPLGPSVDDAVERLFIQVAKTCSSRFEGIAVRTLREGVFVAGPLRYLGNCSVSEEAYRIVSTAAVPNDLESTKQVTLLNMQRRMHKGPR